MQIYSLMTSQPYKCEIMTIKKSAANMGDQSMIPKFCQQATKRMLLPWSFLTFSGLEEKRCYLNPLAIYSFE